MRVLRTARLTMVAAIHVLVAGTAVVVLALAGAPALGVETLSLYDDFSAPHINPNKWFGTEGDVWGPLAAINLGLGGDARREVRAGKLLMSYWGYGSRSSDSFQTFSSLHLNFTNPAGVAAMKATVTVKRFSLVDCPTNPGSVTQTRTILEGTFLNGGARVPGEFTGDVIAFVWLRRAADSPEPGVFTVRGNAYICEDPACFVATFLPGVQLGTVAVGTPATISVQWDPANNQFIYGFNSTTMTIPYPWDDETPPAIPFKALSILHYVDNCTSTPRPQAFLEATFDNVFVNESALGGMK